MNFDSIYSVIEYIGDHYTSLFSKGEMWEKATRFYLENDPAMRQVVGQVWAWDKSPTNDGHDTGIDVVCEYDSATAQANGRARYWAVQCKDYGTKVSLQDLATFWMKSSDEQYAGRMVFSTAEFTENVRKQAAKDGTILVGPSVMAQSNIDWNALFTDNGHARRDTFDLREHQRDAVRDINAKLEGFDRCKAIMACGTGKTLMSLRLAEGRAPHGMVLFAAPSIALVSQAMHEWANQDRVGLRSLVVCSDSSASKMEDEDDLISTVADLAFPASTSASDLVQRYRHIRQRVPEAMVVVFTTYQSMQVIADAQEKGLPSFDLCICDEAHRTTGVAETGDDLTAFMLVHDDSRVHASKRVYMTATPRIYDDKAKAKFRSHVKGNQTKVEESVGVLASMDDEDMFGPVAYEITFAEAVERKLLCDYRVVVLSISEDAVPAYMQEAMFDGEQIPMPDAAKIIGTYKGLVTHGELVQRRLAESERIDEATPDFFLIDEVTADEMEPDGEPDIEVPDDVKPLRRAVGFCSRIADSKRIDRYFKEVVGRYIAQSGEDLHLRCELDHVDGSMDSDTRAEKLNWLASGKDEDECRIVTNARCLAEGVDVPSLDAVIFFAAKKSKVDVIQAVGRVMRTFKNKETGEEKELGYIILPVFIPAGMDAAQALDNSQTFDVVWQVLQALRSHDERIDAYVNTLQFRKKKEEGHGGAGANGKHVIGGEGTDGDEKGQGGQQTQIAFDYGNTDTARAVYAKMVERCGTKIYWETWADDVARVAERHIEQIEHVIGSDSQAKRSFDKFLSGLRASLNPSIRESEAVEMIAQHMITVPVFDALFSDFEFRNSNPVALAIEEFVQKLVSHGVGSVDDDDQRELDNLYASVRRRAAIVRTDFGRQELIKDLYNNFFKKAFSRTSDKMGIVYTPGEIVDAQLHLVDRVLKREFSKSLADEGVNVLDPFAGTGSYMARLIEDPTLIPLERLRHKYLHELHSNELLLLAYYIMVVNIEYSYHSRIGGAYEPYPNALLTDTFQMSEPDDDSDLELFVDNTERVWDQEDLDITVVVSNPPWSVGQKRANDDAANEHYPALEARIEETYSAKSSATNKNSIKDSYLKAFRWASDRIGTEGVVCFVTNSGWLRSVSGPGVRRSFSEEFNSIYVFDFRGNANAKGELRRREGGGVFADGSKAAVAITILVKNPKSDEHGIIRYCEVGDYKTREEKLDVARELVYEDPQWTMLTQDDHGDWFDQRDDSFYEFVPMGLEKYKSPQGMFVTWSAGLKTQRDPWCWGFSGSSVESNVRRLISATNAQIAIAGGDSTVLERDATRFSWTSAMLDRVKRRHLLDADMISIVDGIYRPFCKQRLCYDTELNERTYQQTKLFPLKSSGSTFDNTVITLTTGSSAGTLIANMLPDLHFNGDSQCFPLYWYEKDEGDTLFPTEGEKSVKDAWGNTYIRHDAITNMTIEVFHEAYPSAFHDRPLREGPKELIKEDVFYYVYGILHSPEYRKRFATNLQKELPRIPLAQDFEAFSRAGRALANLHLNYETVEPWAGLSCTIVPGIKPDPVVKLAWGKARDSETKKLVADHTRMVYNKSAVVFGIPERANEYRVNGRSPLEWMIDRYKVTTDKKTGIVNDPNDYSDDPLYILNLIGRLVTVSMRTLDIIANLPPLHEKGHTTNWPDSWNVSNK